MNKKYQRTRVVTLSLCVCCLSIVFLSGCTQFQLPGTSYSGGNGYGTAPILSNLVASPNPTCAGRSINLMATYYDPDADLHFGVAAVSVGGENLSRIAFRTTYPSGTLTIPLAISYYTRSSDVQISLQIRDSYGNWSNTVSTVLSIR